MKIIDLSLSISSEIPNFPGSPLTQIIPWSKIETDGYNLELFFSSTHTGTHMDAPFHFLKNGAKIHEIEPSRFMRNAILIKLKKGPNQSITKTDIIIFEKEFGKIGLNSTIVFFTNWQKNLKKDFYFTKNPGLALTAAKYLAKKKLNLVGIDSPSIDLGRDANFSAHHILAKNNILIVENLCNLEKISSQTFQLLVFPLKLKNATGSPVRAIAVQQTN